MKRTGICTLLLIGGLGTLLADGIDSSVPFYYTVNGGTEEMPLDWSESATSPTRFVKLKTDETGFVYTNWLNASFRLDGTKKVLYWAMGATYRDFGVYARTLNCATMTTGWHWEQPTDYGFMMYPRLVLEAEPDGINVTEAIIPTYNTQSEDPRGLRLCGTVDPSLAGKTILATLSNAALGVQERYAFTARSSLYGDCRPGTGAAEGLRAGHQRAYGRDAGMRGKGWVGFKFSCRAAGGRVDVPE